MDFKDVIKLHSERVEKLKDNIQTEEATKNALIMPFIQALGYDVFNPFEVIPEYTCDIGTKKGEKIDYAIFQNEEPIILIECKHSSVNLDLYDNQLLRYYHVSKAKFGILTNGIQYRFYTDLEEANKMDEKPFLEVNLLDIREPQFEELKKFHKSYFNIDNIVNSASELKYTNELKQIILNEINAPSEALVRLFAKQVYSGMVTSKILEQFSSLTKKSFNQVINDIITDKFKSALNVEKEAIQKEDSTNEISEVTVDKSDERQIETTVEEQEGFYIVRAILRPHVSIDRVAHRDTLSYFGVLFDDNNRKPICRLYFNGSKKYVSTFDADKKETKHPIDKLDDIYSLSDHLIKSVKNYIEE